MTLQLEAVSYRYAGSTAAVLEGIDLTLEPGEVVGVVGANEAGKSTLCLVAAGLAPATIGGQLGGTVRVDGLVTSNARPFELAQRCGSLFQNPSTQISGTAPTVWEELAFGPRNLALPITEIVQRVDEAAGAMGIPDLLARDPGLLSGGQAQLVALAGVLSLRPAYLILDEPTSQLDPLGTRLVGEALAALATRGGVGILIVEHKTDLLAALASRVIVIAAGRQVAAGHAADVLADGRLPGWGVEPPSAIRLAGAAAAAGVTLA